MATFTSRMGLTKPLGTEPRSVTPLNLNADTLDAFMPFILVNDGVVPPTASLYDGAMVKEKTSGKVWEARKNGGGTFDVVWTIYPYTIRTFGSGAILATGSSLQNIGVGSFVDGINSSAANIANVPGQCVAPVAGIYNVQAIANWNSNSTGQRTLTISKNATVVVAEAEHAVNANGGGIETKMRTMLAGIPLAAGDLMGLWGWQTSGGNLGLFQYMQMTLITPRT